MQFSDSGHAQTASTALLQRGIDQPQQDNRDTKDRQMSTFTPPSTPIDVADVERRAHELRAEFTAQAFRSLRAWLADHLTVGKRQSPST
ncbi:hypothetical protein Dshi_1770 [Dinoroseobacter shibae DFL 12 = DSM 16493]|uniref:Uncharacterized protein n=2 Tax=Roseobacteraceae TaxID=2854170 RepID=A8LMG7_DINSH|nr:hypothetical protein Dshi_1770 [Dinoroseobacter shibae DFL 12 = DSM 16493]